jgi:hypothetical protein
MIDTSIDDIMGHYWSTSMIVPSTLQCMNASRSLAIRLVLATVTEDGKHSDVQRAARSRWTTARTVFKSTNPVGLMSRLTMIPNFEAYTRYGFQTYLNLLLITELLRRKREATSLNSC